MNVQREAWRKYAMSYLSTVDEGRSRWLKGLAQDAANFADFMLAEEKSRFDPRADEASEERR